MVKKLLAGEVMATMALLLVMGGMLVLTVRLVDGLRTTSRWAAPLAPR